MTLPTFVAASSYIGAAVTATVPLPTGTEVDDVLVLLAETANQAVTALSGWTEIASSPQGTGTTGDTSATRLTARWKRATAYEFSVGAATTPAEHIGAVMLAFRGCPTSGNPINVSAGSTEANNDTSVSIPGATTTVDDCLVVAAVAHHRDIATAQFSAWANSDLGSVAEIVDAGTTQGNGGGIGVATGTKAAAGAYGATTATCALTSNYGLLSFALAPAISGPAPATSFPEDVDTFFRDEPGDTVTSNEGNQRNEALTALQRVTVGPVFHSASAYEARDEKLIADFGATTNWFSTNLATGLQTDSVNKTLGTSSLKVAGARYCWDNNPDRTTKAYVNLVTAAPKGDYGDLAIDWRWQFSSSADNHYPSDFFEWVVSDTVDLGGTLVTYPLTVNASGAFTTAYIPVASLTSVRSFGIRFIPTKEPAIDSTGMAMAFNLDNLRWAAQSEFDRAAEAVDAVVIPPTYSPSITRTLDVPASRSVIDLRPQGYIANNGGVKHLRQFQVFTEDGSGDVRQSFSDAVSSLQDGDHLLLPPGKHFKVTGTSDRLEFRGLNDVVIDGNNSVIFSDELRTTPLVRMAECHNVTIRRMRFLGSTPTTHLGSTFTTVNGTPTVVGTTVQLDALNEEVRPSFVSGVTPDRFGKADFDVTLSDSAQVANDCVIEIVDTKAPTIAEQASFTATASGTTGPLAAGTRYYRVAYVDGDGYETGVGPAIAVTLSTPGTAVDLAGIPVASDRNAPVRQRNIYRTAAGAVDTLAAYNRVAEIYDNTTTTWRDRASDGPAHPAGSTALTAVNGAAGVVDAGEHKYFYSYFNSTTGIEGPLNTKVATLSNHDAASAVSVAGIGIGPAGTTERRIYRTKANNSGEGKTYYVGTVAGNVTTTFTDNVADASLGEAGPENVTKFQPPIFPRKVLTLTSTPTTYRLTLPGESAFFRRFEMRVRKATATANTITVHSAFTDRTRGGGSFGSGGAYESYHTVSLGVNCTEITFEDCEFDGGGGDGINAASVNNAGDGALTLRRCAFRNNGRHGVTVSGNMRVLVDSALIALNGQWGIDVEPETYGAYVDEAVFRDIDFYECGSSRGAISAAIGQNRAGRITIERCRSRGRTGQFSVSAMIVTMDQIDAPWYGVTANARQSIIGRVRCKQLSLPNATSGTWTSYASNSLAAGTVVYGPVVFTSEADPLTALDIDDDTIPIGPVIWPTRAQLQVNQLPVLISSGAPEDADYPFTPPAGTFGYDSTNDRLYLRTSASPPALVGVALDGAEPAAGITLTTASISPTTSVVFVGVLAQSAAATTPTVTSISGLGGTWTQETSATTGSPTHHRLSLWKGVGVSGTGTLTITQSGVPADGNGYVVFEFTNIDPDTPVVRTYANGQAATATSANITPVAMARVNNAIVALVRKPATGDMTALQGTELIDRNGGSAYGIEVTYVPSWTSGVVGASWVTTAANRLAAGAEIAAEPSEWKRVNLT